MTPLVSVVMSVRDGERYLAAAMDSILGQTWDELECVVVDDGSTDLSGAILEGYARTDHRVKVVQSPARGLPAALTEARQHVRGTYIARMDGDDVCPPYRLERQVEFLEEHRDIALVGGAYALMREDGTVFDTVNVPLTNTEIQATLLHHNCFGQITVMMRAESYDEVGGYREPFQVGEDYDLWTRLADHHRLANLPEVLTYWRIHSGQITQRTLIQQTLNAIAIRRATQLRRQGARDPFAPSTLITRGLLMEMGVREEDIDNLVLDSHWYWFERLRRAKYPALARRVLEAAVSFCATAQISRRERGLLHRRLARFSMEHGDLGTAALAAVRACLLEPTLLAQMACRRLGRGNGLRA